MKMLGLKNAFGWGEAILKRASHVELFRGSFFLKKKLLFKNILHIYIGIHIHIYIYVYLYTYIYSIYIYHQCVFCLEAPAGRISFEQNTHLSQSWLRQAEISCKISFTSKSLYPHCLFRVLACIIFLWIGNRWCYCHVVRFLTSPCFVSCPLLLKNRPEQGII